MTANTDMRAAFEVFMLSERPTYKATDDSIECRKQWRAWQAATIAAAERAAKLCAQTGEHACDMYGDGAECLETASMCADAIRQHFGIWEG